MGMTIEFYSADPQALVALFDADLISEEGEGELFFEQVSLIFSRPSCIMAAIDRGVHYSVILDMVEVESYRAQEANHQHLRDQAEATRKSAEMVAIGGTNELTLTAALVKERTSISLNPRSLPSAEPFSSEP